MTSLKKLQQEILSEFYSVPKTKVIFKQSVRKKLWKKATAREAFSDFDTIEEFCPALAHQIKKSYEGDKNIQSAVFSECVYAQTFANMLNLDIYINCHEETNCIPTKVQELLKTHRLVPRYVYTNTSKSRMLVQAGGRNGIDCALISLVDLKIHTIEFKEPNAKSSEPDLPKYDEDGNLVITEEFIEKYPQFSEMLNEQKNLNFFDIMGNNVHGFSEKSVEIAVSQNYTKKYADVICTEDKDGYLTMLPVNQVYLWAKTEGEIRPAGRNHYKVWTPNTLKKILKSYGATFKGDFATVPISKLSLRKERGGNGKISGYKLAPVFFVFKDNYRTENKSIIFDINSVRQLRPTIAGKMSFKALKYKNVKEHYNL